LYRGRDTLAAPIRLRPDNRTGIAPASTGTTAFRFRERTLFRIFPIAPNASIRVELGKLPWKELKKVVYNRF
jgi:hypothetical protein